MWYYFLDLTLFDLLSGFGCYRGWRIRVFDFTLGTLASRTTFLWWSTSFARILIQPKFSTRMTLVCTLDPFLAFWAFCWKRLLLTANRISCTGGKLWANQNKTNLSRVYVHPNVFSLLFWHTWWRSFLVRHSHIGFHLDKIESIRHLDTIWKNG